MSVYLALHAPHPTVKDFQRLTELTEALGIPGDTSPAVMDWKEGSVTLVVPLDQLLELIHFGKSAKTALGLDK